MKRIYDILFPVIGQEDAEKFLRPFPFTVRKAIPCRRSQELLGTDDETLCQRKSMRRPESANFSQKIPSSG